MPQFNRKARVVVWDQIAGTQLTIEGLRITFQVEKTRVSNTVDKAQIQIYGLSRATRGSFDYVKIFQQKIYVYLYVGYEVADTHIFQGQLCSYSHTYEGPEIVTHMTVYDGSDIQHKHVKGSHKKNATPQQVLDHLKREAALTIEYPPALLNAGTQPIDSDFKEGLSKPFSSGYSYSGAVTNVLDDMTSLIGADWTIQDGVVKISPLGFGTGGDIYLLSAASGMIGVPTKIDDITSRFGKQKRKNQGEVPTAPGYMVKTLLNPRLRPYSTVRVLSNKIGIDSQCVIGAVTHEGDTHGADWVTTSRVTLA